MKNWEKANLELHKVTVFQSVNAVFFRMATITARDLDHLAVLQFAWGALMQLMWGFVEFPIIS